MTDDQARDLTPTTYAHHWAGVPPSINLTDLARNHAPELDHALQAANLTPTSYPRWALNGGTLTATVHVSRIPRSALEATA